MSEVKHKQGCDALGGYGHGVGLCSCGAQPAQAGQVLTRHEQEDLYRETSNRVAQLEAENRYEFASWFFIAVELVEQAVRAKLGAGVPMTDPQLQTSEERRATGDRILELIEKQHPGIVGEKGGVFAGKTPDNVILNGEDLDRAIDAAIAAGKGQG